MVSKVLPEIETLKAKLKRGALWSICTGGSLSELHSHPSLRQKLAKSRGRPCSWELLPWLHKPSNSGTRVPPSTSYSWSQLKGGKRWSWNGHHLPLRCRGSQQQKDLLPQNFPLWALPVCPTTSLLEVISVLLEQMRQLPFFSLFPWILSCL